MLILVNGATATVRRLAARGQPNLGALVTPTNIMADALTMGLPWAADNEAFVGFDAARFRRMLWSIKRRPNGLFVVCPDSVGNARATLDLFAAWEGEVLCAGHPVAFVLQDGQEDLELPEADAYFVGGSTRFKISRAADDLIKEGKRRGKWVHMGRVNTKRRIRHAHERGVDSIDGTSMSMYGNTYIQDFCDYTAMLDTYARVRG